MIDTSRYEGLTNDGKWRGTSADDSVIFEVHDEHGEVVDFKTIALVMRDSDHYGTEDNPDIRLMVDAPVILEAYKMLRSDMAYCASLITCMIDMGDPLSLFVVREGMLGSIGMTVDEAMATTDLMGD